jgi:glycosyltransferase involved in cell wall biosynthesis
VPEEKIVFIHHGIPDTPFIDPSFNKDKFGVEGKKVLLTFGLLSPNKGIENVLQALPAVINKHPDVAYIILGATHPHILKQHGDAYRIMLQQLVRKLDIGAHVIFQNRFVELKELCEFLGIADIYITPILKKLRLPPEPLPMPWAPAKPSFRHRTGMPPRCLPKAGAELCPSAIRMPWHNRSSTFWTMMSSGTPCAKRPIRSPGRQCGRKSPGNISRFSVKFGKTEPATPGHGIPTLKISRPLQFRASGDQTRSPQSLDR